MSTNRWASASDEELVAGLAARDERAVEALLSRHWTSAWRVAQQLTGDDAGAEDVAQEALVRVLQAAPRFAPGAAFRPWFFTIVRNAARDQAKREQRRAAHEAGAPARRAESEDGVVKDEVATVVRAELERLKPEQREVVSLHYVAGLTLQEIASALGCPFGTVSSRLGRGLTALRKALPAGVAVGAGVIASAAGEASAAPSAATLLTRATTSEAARPLAPPVAGPAPAGRVTRLGPAAALVVATVGVAALALGALLDTTPEVPPQAPPPAVATSPAGPAGAVDATFDVADGAGEPPEKPVAPAPADDDARPDARGAARADARDKVLRGRVMFQGAPRAGVRVALGAGSPAGETVTDAAGAFALAVSEPPPEHLTLTLWVPERGLATELMPPEPHGVLVRFRLGPEGPARDHLEVGRAPAGELELHVCSTTVSGRAVDASSGAPVADARVALIGAEVATDADGRFQLVAPRAVHGARLVATHPDRAPEVRQLDRVPERVDDALLSLEPPLALEGQVLDPQGRPAAGAEVTAHDPLPLGRGEGSFPVLRRRTLRADASGRFRVDGLHPAATLNVGRASAFVVVAYPGCLAAQASLAGDGREVTLIRLAAAHEVTGRVLLPDGAPATGAVVVPFPTTTGAASRRFSRSSGPDDALDDEVAGLPGATRADAQGRFGVRLQPGPWRLLVHAGVGLADRVVQVTAPTDAPLEVVLGPSASLEGRVTGEGVRGLVVTAYPAGDRGRPTIPLTATTTDADGRFVLAGLEPAARVDVVVTTTYSSQVEAEATDASAGAPLELARRPLPRETYVTVELLIVAGESGEPLADAWLMTRTGLVTCEDGDGRFTHPLPVEAGTSGALAVVGAPGRLPVVVGPLERAAPPRTVSLSVGAGRIDVAVDVGDLTVSHADVEWRDPGTERRCSKEVTARGGRLRATLDGVTPGACEVRARVWVGDEDAPRTVTSHVVVAREQATPVELRVR